MPGTTGLEPRGCRLTRRICLAEPASQETEHSEHGGKHHGSCAETAAILVEISEHCISPDVHPSL
jgi:hypothetical protein